MSLKSIVQKVAFSSVLATSISACGPHHGSSLTSNGSMNLAGIVSDSNQTPGEKSEHLAEAAERLLTPGSLMMANEVATVALEQDPTNRKARLIAALTAPQMELKGVIKRLEPLFKKSQHGSGNYQKFEAGIKRDNPEQALTRFLFDGPADIHTEKEAQELITRYTLKVDELRKTMRDLKTGDELELKVSASTLLQLRSADFSNQCMWTELSPLSFQSNCDFTTDTATRINQADMEAIEQVAAGYEVTLTILNSWDLSGLVSKVDQFGVSTPAEQAAALFSDASFGILRDKNALTVIPDVASDLIVGLHYAQSMQAVICPQGQSQIGSRAGYLFANGLCTPGAEATDHVIAMLELMLKGQTVGISTAVQGQNVNVGINVMSLVQNPVSDLRSELPIKTNICSDITSIGDGTFGGVFPSGDVNVILGKESQSCTVWGERAQIPAPYTPYNIYSQGQQGAN